MIEWSRNNGDRRIKRKFCFLPYYCQGKIYTWLGFRYEFQRFLADGFSSPSWYVEAILSPSQYKEFCADLHLHLTDPEEQYREYANIILKQRRRDGS